MQRTLLFGISAITLAFAILLACSKSETTTTSGTTYAATSSTGDYAQWTISGTTLSGTWQVTNSTGAITKTLTITATCGSADATYGYMTCAVSSSSCADGTTVCGASDAPAAGTAFYAFEVPGFALFVKAQDGNAKNELQVGFALDTTCPTASATTSDYSFIHLGNAQTDLFGVMRITPTFTALTHADFRMGRGSCTAGTSSGGCSATPTVLYSNGNGTGTGVETITSTSCSSGVQTVVLNGSLTIRASASTSGNMIVDFPSGLGGIIAFPVSTAATLSDLASRSFGGIVFPDNGSANLATVTTGAVSGSTVPVSAITFQNGGSTNIVSPMFRAAANTSTLTSPAYPNFTAVPTGYSNNPTLPATYATPSAIPGLFVIDGASATDNGRVVTTAMKYNGKTYIFGAVYNWRNNQYGYSSFDNVNSGAFIFFQK